ncbi:DMT family transporter [uncultured Flavobacterium sp.]|uniref:DMT family transporter n=1 Tax=uncultured Flavobacterium sp. TaxID=165435 RepID=UPI0030CA2737|tara:strand:+ start:1371 stop:2231 length:861 start_codon:yes stop_codon:yes gene_type:complete
MKNIHLKNLSVLVLATLFISTSGVLGKYIALPSEIIIWFRAFIAMLFLYLFCTYKNIDLKIKSTKDYIPFLISGVFMAAHWVTYFYALKLSNVALGVLSLYTFPVITALLEPVFLRVKFNPVHIFLAFLVFTGIYILTPEFNLESAQLQGILFGVFSAFCYTIRILILKKHVSNNNGIMLMFYQTLIVSVVLLPTLFFMDFSGLLSQLPYLFLLAILTTALGHTLMLQSLKHFSATTTAIVSSLQPVFGIILAFFFLSELPSINVYLGGSLILLTAIIEGVRSNKK